MTRRQLPRATAAQLDAATFLPGEIAVDLTNDEIRYDGDGNTLGGIKLARKDGVGTSVTATGSTTARTLADRFGDAWVNVKDFGARGDLTFNSSGVIVSGTDDTAAIQAAIDYLEATTLGRGIVFFPRGWYRISAKLRIKKGILLQGVGRGHNHDGVAAVNVNIPDAGSALYWVNPTGDIMVHMEPAVTNGRRISGGGVVDMALYGNQQATYGVYARSVNGASFKFYGEHHNTATLYLGVVPAADGIVAEARDCQFVDVDIAARNTASNGGSILVLQGDSSANVSLCEGWRVWPALHLNGDAIDLINCDNIKFEAIRTFRFPGGTGRALNVRGGPTAEESARGIEINHITATASDGTLQLVYGGLDDYAVPTVGNYIKIDSENNTPLPTVGKGATVQISNHDDDNYFGLDRFNLIVNGDFALNQLNASSCTDKTPGFDGGVVLTQSAAVTVSSVSAPETGQAQCLRITQADASAQRFGYAWVVPQEETVALRGVGVSFIARARLSTTADVRVAILEWTGTANSADADVVNDWTSTTYTGGNFFKSTTLNVLCVLETPMTANTWRNLSGRVQRAGATATVGASANNLIVFVWVEGTAAQNVTLDIGKARFVPGYMPTFEVYEDRATMIARAERQVQKSYPIATAPGASIAQGAPNFTSRAADQADRWYVPFRTRMLKQPAMTVYSTTGASGNVRNLSAAADLTANTASPGEAGFLAFPTANTVAGQIYAFNWVATAYPWA